MAGEKKGKFDQKALDRIADKVLAYRPKKGEPKEKPAKAAPQPEGNQR